VFAPVFIPMSNRMFEDIVRRAYSKARELAEKFGGVVEPLRPHHVYSGNDVNNYVYTLKLGEISLNLTENSKLIVYGIYNADQYFDYLQIIEGSRTIEWFVEPVYYYPEKIAVWGEGPLVLDGKSAKFFVHTSSTDESKDRVFGWPQAFVVIPKVSIQPVKPPRPRKGRRSKEEK